MVKLKASTKSISSGVGDGIKLMVHLLALWTT